MAANLDRSMLFPRVQRALTALPILLCGALIYSACDFNVELTDEKRVLRRIEGTSPCDADKRTIASASGKHTLRIFLVDNRKEAFEVDGIDGEPFNLSPDKLKIMADSNAPKVYESENGDQASGASATLSIDKSSDVKAVPSPRYVAMKEQQANQRVPKAVSLLLDMSETASKQDPNSTRTTQPASWILENFNGDSQDGELDIFGATIVRNGRLSSDDNLFKKEPPERQYIGLDGQARGFLPTTDETDGDEGNKQLVSSKFTGSFTAFISGSPPMYEAINGAAIDLRKVSTESGEFFFNPAVIAVSLERDTSIVDKGSRSYLTQAKESVKGGGDDTDAVPLFSILYPRPQEATPEEWDTHLNNLCQIAREARTTNPSPNYMGQLLHVHPAPGLFTKSLTTALNTAYHAMGGFVEIKINYDLKGLKAGKEYMLEFSLYGKLLDEETESSEPPKILVPIKLK